MLHTHSWQTTAKDKLPHQPTPARSLLSQAITQDFVLLAYPAAMETAGGDMSELVALIIAYHRIKGTNVTEESVSNIFNSFMFRVATTKRPFYYHTGEHPSLALSSRGSPDGCGTCGTHWQQVRKHNITHSTGI